MFIASADRLQRFDERVEDDGNHPSIAPPPPASGFPGEGMQDLGDLLQIAARDHAHLCPRIVLGVRIGMAGVAALGFALRPPGKYLLAIVESDGCFADGISAASACTVGHRTLRVEDYGKVAATFVHVDTGRAVRVAPALDARERAEAWLPGERRRYFTQLRAYQTLPDELLLTVTEVQLAAPVRDLISRPAVRVNCTLCGEEIVNEREVLVDGRALCRACAGTAYYRPAASLPLALRHDLVRVTSRGTPDRAY